VEVVENWGEGLPYNSVPHVGQALSISECVYRNMYWVKYLVFTDLDEYIVPRKSMGWPDMMEQLENEKYASYMFRNVFYFERNDTGRGTARNEVRLACDVEMPKFLTRVFRSSKIWDSGRRSKYILKPLYVQSAAILVHQVRHGKHARYIVPPEFALLNHYRQFRKRKLQEMRNEKGFRLIFDERTVAYKEKIVAALNKRLCGHRSVHSNNSNITLTKSIINFVRG
jgi:hypothetical protein